jgi:hypothetical protein
LELEDDHKRERIALRGGYVSPMEENRKEEFENAPEDTAVPESVGDADEISGENFIPDEGGVGTVTDGDDGLEVGSENGDGVKTLREQYEKLVKSRFKELFDEDVQKLINRRFRKYKILEERYKLLEKSLKEKEDAMTAAEKRIADFDERLRSEVEKAAENAERSVLERLKARRLRPGEVGIAPRKTASPFDVSGLSRKERADIARRAAWGEKIKF